jgi:hypothetical protein
VNGEKKNVKEKNIAVNKTKGKIKHG